MHLRRYDAPMPALQTALVSVLGKVEENSATQSQLSCFFGVGSG